MSTRHQAHLCEQALGRPNGRWVETATAGRSLTLPATHEHLHQLEALRTLGLLGGGAEFGGLRPGPPTPPKHSHGAAPARTHLAPEQRKDLQHHSPGGALCGHADGHVGHTHPAGNKLRSLDPTAPTPPSSPLADPGPRAWVSLEPGRVDLQDLLGAGQSTDDAGLGHGLSGPRAPAALLLCNPTAPGSSPRPGVSGVHRLGERLQLKVPRVLGDVVSPQRCLLRGGGGAR